MTPQHSKAPGRVAAIVAIVAITVSLSSATGSGTDQPQPTPRPGTLGAYARTVTLDRSALGDQTGRLVLTNGKVERIGDGASITLGSVETAKRVVSKPSKAADSAARERWRSAHQKQRRVIADLERRLSLIEIEIDHIEDQRLTPKTLARLDRAESKRRHLEQEIARAREALARIVRDARREGAEPGWFR
jgi:hypothetical protein